MTFGIFGTSYIKDVWRMDLVRLWVNLAERLNPDIPLCVVDSDSPMFPPDILRTEIIQLGNNIGHYSFNQVDGWGRAFTAGLQWGLDNQFDYLAYIDTDIIFCRSVAPILEQMQADGTKVAMPKGDTYPWPENGIMFFDMNWVRDVDFIGQYDWQHIDELPEWRCKHICGNDLKIIDLPGRRHENGSMSADELFAQYPNGCAWLTHSPDMMAYKKLLDVNGLSDVWEKTMSGLYYK